MSLRPVLDDAALSALLREDAPHGDLTTASLGIGAQAGEMVLTTRGAQQVACLADACRLVELAGGTVMARGASGVWAETGALLLHAQGPAEALLLAWKTSQTLLEYTNGIASATHALVQAVAALPQPPVIACTRKTFPGTRALAARAVVEGGGVMHRLGLSETLLVFPEHATFFPADDFAQRGQAVKRRSPEKRLVIEVCSLPEVSRALDAGADVLQLEKFTPPQVADVRALLDAQQASGVVLAVAGGITPSNALAYAEAGATVLVTSYPYFAPPKDVQVRFRALTA